MRREQAVSEVEVGELPDCDMCDQIGVTRDAEYDGATVMGPWANMCGEHFGRYGVGLGTGRGQRLVLRGIPRETAERVREVIARYLGVPAGEIFMADHNHEGISPGSWSFAYEADTERLAEVPGETRREGTPYQLPETVWLEQINSFAVAAHLR